MRDRLRRIWRLWRRLLLLTHAPRDWAYCALHGVKWRASWELCALPLLRKGRNAKITIGARLTAVSRSRENSLGVFQHVILTSYGDLRIGDDVGLSGCSVSCSKAITIGDRVLIGSGVLITDSDAHPICPVCRATPGNRLGVGEADIVIGDDVFIGARAIILKGVHVGRGAVVGAGAVVTRNVAEYTIVAGNPAKTVGDVWNCALHAPGRAGVAPSQSSAPPSGS